MDFIIGMKNSVIFIFFAIFVINILMLGKERSVLLSCLNRVWDAFGQ